MAWVAPAIGIGSAVLGGKKGKKAAQNPAADTQSQLAQQLFSETDPLRQSLIGRSAGFLGVNPVMGVPAQPRMIQGPFGIMMPDPNGGSGPPLTMPAQPGFGDVRSTPTYTAFKDTADRTFARARDNTLGQVAPGGALTAALTNLEGDRAATLTQGAGSIYNDELSRAMTLATGQTGTAMSGLGAAANAQAYSAQAAAEQNAAKSGALGTGLGAWIGHKQGSGGGTRGP